MYHAALSTATIEGAGGCTEEENWKFEIGQCVTHISQPLPSLVMWRTMCDGREVYGLRSFLDNGQNRGLLILAESLRAAVPHSADCDNCLLYDTGLCPGLLGLP